MNIDRKHAVAVSLGVLVLVLGGCSQTTSSRGRAPAGSEGAPARVIATVGHEAVTADDLMPALYEIAGREALREWVLDRALQRAIENRGLAITPDMLRAERTLLAERTASGERLQSGAGLTEQVLRERHLGPVRRESMIRRNAGLRLLTRDEVRVEPEEVSLAAEIAYGPKYRARVILAGTEREAGEALTQLGARPTPADVARLAERYSIDPSARTGGVLPLISPVDPAYPVAVRSALGELLPGHVSSIIPLPAGAAVVYLESVEPRSIVPEDAIKRLEAELRVQRERVAMERLARQLVESTRVDVLDRSLGWAWDGR